MPISFECPQCGAQTEVADQYAGQTGPCSECGATITIPGTPAAPPPSSAPARGSSMPIILVLVVVGVVGVCVIGVLAAVMLPALQAARGAARRAQCTSNMHQIALAMQTYDAMHGSFPPAYIADEDGQPMHSWRVLILPFLDEQGLYDQYDFDEPWDGPNNSRLADMMPGVYQCPSGGQLPAYTVYVVIAGPGTMFEGDQAARPADVRDGMSNTIILVESSGSAVHWMKPADLRVDQMSFTINDKSAPSISSEHPGGAMAVFADTHFQFLHDGFDEESLRAMTTEAGGEVIEVFDVYEPNF